MRLKGLVHGAGIPPSGYYHRKRTVTLTEGVTLAANLNIELDRTPRAPGEARRAIESLNGDIEPRILPDVKLLVSELVTNSVKYGGHGPVRLEVTAGPEKFRAEVVDQGSGFEPQERSDDLEEVGGWGLPLVENLADRWGTHEGSTHVWFEIDL